MSEPNQVLCINVPVVVETKDCLACVRRLGKKLMDNGYVSWKEAIEDISLLDLELLLRLFDSKDVVHQSEVALFSGLLMLGEGLVALNDATFQDAYIKTAFYLSCEYLTRKGFATYDITKVTYVGDLDKSIMQYV